MFEEHRACDSAERNMLDREASQAGAIPARSQSPKNGLGGASAEAKPYTSSPFVPLIRANRHRRAGAQRPISLRRSGTDLLARLPIRGSLIPASMMSARVWGGGGLQARGRLVGSV